MNLIQPVAIVMFIKEIGNSQFKLWMQPRREKGPLAGLWEFPGGKIEKGEDSEQAARREILEEVEVKLSEDDPLPLFALHPYHTSYQGQGRSICLYVHLGRGGDGNAAFERAAQTKGRWFDISYQHPTEGLRQRIPPVNHWFIDRLAEYLKEQVEAHTLEDLWYA